MRLGTVLAALLLLAACGGAPDPTGGASRSSVRAVSPAPAPSSASTAASSAPRAAASPLPDVASPSRPGALATQLTAALATLSDQQAAEPDVRRAALTEQLAARRLAAAPESTTAAVVRRLARPAADQVTSDVAAARELAALTVPQPRLPKWRIVTPPPADELLAAYHRADRLTGVPWAYLAAINLVETRMGRIRGTSTAGARGPMQFLPSTFEQYAPGGDIDAPDDAILAAARMLRANGAPGDLDAALYAYNHSSHYVRAVTAYATRMAASPTAYRSYWHWQVLYHRTDRTFLLPEGYPHAPAVPLPDR